MMQRSPVQRFLTFRLDAHIFALPVARVREINLITELDSQIDPSSFRMTIRDKEFPLVPLRHKFDLPHKLLDQNSRVVLVDTPDGAIGLLVDGIERVVDRAITDQAKSHSPILSALESQHIQDHPIILIDIVACLKASTSEVARAFSALFLPAQIKAS